MSKKCSEHRTISLISHPSKVLLTIILNRIKPGIEEILDDSQAGFRKDRSTVEQILNLRLLCESQRNHQKNVFHNFIDFKKAFDRVWHEALWHTMAKYNINQGMTRLIQELYENAKTTVMVGNNYSEWFESTVGVRQGCILSPTLFNLFLERIMQDALENFSGGIKCTGRVVNNLRFADDIDLIAEDAEELAEITRRLDETSHRYGMEISAEKSKIMVSGRNINRNVLVYVRGEQLEHVSEFKYLGATLTENGTSEIEVKHRVGMATSALARLESIWKMRSISMKTKIKLLNSMVKSILMYGCESWTITDKIWKKVEAFEMKCYRRLLGITWRERQTNGYVWNKIIEHFTTEKDRPEPFMRTIAKRKLQFFGHQVRRNKTTKFLIQDYCEGTRQQGRPIRTWQDDIKEWTSLNIQRACHHSLNRRKWRKDAKTWVHQRPNRLRS